ncbi:hypothetical protein U9K52_08750 [Chryseobacterium sp. MHB01]|uniref:hypothetical protein n=1 Tax=Chryseobacterium sp. MHB01 TaxID=3109433 RepID=UPI002AFE9F04|nr:hypothetical protein [Chryseobacterium sp. MHB01]MEA1848996.1 hypothetical protein [Chryseobacterium sp. MHB01]
MNSINFRIKKIVDDLYGGRNTNFANSIGVDEANIRNYLKGTEPKHSFFEKIFENTNISVKWLITGKGNMLEKTEIKPAETIANPHTNAEIANLSSENKINILLERTSEILVMNQNLLEENKKLSAEREELKDAYENLDSKFDNLTLLFDMYMSPIYRSMGLNRIDMKEVKEQITKSEK